MEQKPEPMPRKPHVKAAAIPALLILAMLLASAAPSGTEAYIMPAEQVIHLMTQRFSGFKTLKVIQSAQIVNPHDKSGRILLEEKLYLKAPHFYCLQWSYPSPAAGSSPASGTPAGEQAILTALGELQRRKDVAYRRLVLASDATGILALLSRWGVDPAKVAFTRLEGKAAYRLGAGRTASPELLVEKDRFLPLLIRYPLESDSGRELVSIRFEKYRRLKQGWYPYEIYYRDARGNLLAAYETRDLFVNPPIEVPLARIRLENTRPPRLGRFSAAVTPPEPGTATDDRVLQEKRLREIIIDLREKYR
jgi:hypothetical protein